MASSSSTPALGPSPDCVRMRLRPHSGIYHSMRPVMAKRTGDWFGCGTMNLGENYKITNGKGNSKPGRWGSSTLNLMDRSECELSTTIVAEVCPREDGSQFGALGNYVAGTGDRSTLKDGGSCRNVYIVRKPTGANKLMTRVWKNTDAEIAKIEQHILETHGAIGSGIRSVAADGETAVLRIASEPIYQKVGSGSHARPASSVPIAAKETFTQDELDASDDDDAADMDSVDSGTGEGSDDGMPDHWDQDAPVNGRAPARPGATYPLKSLPDHKGPTFEMTSSVVVQHDVTNLAGNLIHPRDLAFYMKPGVLLMMCGRFTIWHPTGRDPIVQFIASGIKIIADSDAPPQIPVANLEPLVPRVAKNVGDKRTAAFAEFATDLADRKRPRADEDTEHDINKALPGPEAVDEARSNTRSMARA